MFKMQMLNDMLGSGLFGGLLTFASILMAPASAQAQDWSLLNALLKDHVAPAVSEGIAHNRVNYQALGQDPRFASLLAQIEQYPVDELVHRDERLAFYINAYNIYAIKMVIEHLPLDSIRDVGSLFSPVWQKPIGTLGGRAVTLDEIEHGILRPMGEPGIHFAIVCASLSCPNLRTEAFRADILRQQLEAQIRDFLDNESKGLSVDGSRVRVSQIFDWFEEDFAVAGGVESFLRRYQELPAGISVRANLPYNWNLNGE